TGDLGPEMGALFSQVRNTAEPGSDLRAKYLAAMAELHDRLLGWKVSCVWYPFSLDNLKAISPAARALIKEGIEHGKARGVGALLYSMNPFAGRVADYPDFARPCLGPGRYPAWIRCWSLDDMRRRTADEFARFCADVGLTDLGFHDTDTGGFLNPAEWNDRCQTCRQRWGNDYAAATAHIYRIYYDAIRKRLPDARMHIVIYPYGIGILTQDGAERYVTSQFGPGPGVADSARGLRQQWEPFWRRITDLLPKDITFCFRETHESAVKAFRALVGDRGLFPWIKLLTDPWVAFYSESPRWTGTFHGNRRDFLFSPTLETFLPLQALAVREYAWNASAPGAATWNRLPVEDEWKHCEPRGEVYEVVLPHVARNLFGRRVGDQVAAAAAKNVCPYEIFGNKLFGGVPTYLKTYERMQWQADLAAQGADLLDRAWARRASADDKLGMTDFAFRRFIYLRETFRCCKWMATALAHNLRARELAREGKLAEAKAALDAGKAAVEAGKRDNERLLSERPPDAVYEAREIFARKRVPHFRLFTPGVVNYDEASKPLQQTEQELPTLVAAAGLSQDILKRLEQRRVVHVGRLAGEITHDGRLDEPAWATVYPSESFFVYQEGRKAAVAATTARLLCDGRCLYVGVRCWTPDGEMPVAQPRERDGAVLEDDSVEIFLAPPDLKRGYVHLALNAAGSLRDQRATAVPDATGVVSLKRDPAWNAESIAVKTTQRAGRWDAEVRIPLDAFTQSAPGAGWKANLTREYRGATGVRELSSILPTTCKDFHDVASFRQVVFTPAEFQAPPPQAEVEIAGFTSKTETLDDRIAAVCLFGLDVQSSRVLHDASLIAEAIGPGGETQQRVALASRQAVLYQWTPSEPFEVAFAQPVKAGGIRVTLKSDETTVSRWMRIGGWEGSPKAGGVLAGGGVGSGALADACCFASRATTKGGQETPILNSRAGTIEFWLKPEWAGSAAPLAEDFEMWPPRRCFIHFGPARKDNPYLYNHSSVTLRHLAPSTLVFTITDSSYAGWSASASLAQASGWEPGRWHHLAAVWDAESPRADWLRLYVDGKRLSSATAVSKEDRLGADASVRVRTSDPYAIQLGSLTTGRMPARALMDELRISRVARYRADFAPTREPFSLDEHTTALFHFDGALSGAGRAADGPEYGIYPVPGVVEHH
ncbi:MAG: hypothetical protein FJ279_18025, partial [Planctomycetes bacterium]|nr:hypothetical protein [Planctomycetota bacterium]